MSASAYGGRQPIGRKINRKLGSTAGAAESNDGHGGRSSSGGGGGAARGAAAVVAATLANAELAAAKTASAHYHAQFTATDGENDRLRADLEQQGGDSLLVIRHLEGQLVAAFEEAAAFKRAVADKLARQTAVEGELKAHYEDLIAARDRSIADYAALIARLQDDLRQASRFARQRQEHQQELLKLHTTMEELVAAHEKETAALRFQNVDRKMKLVSLEATMRDEFQELVDRESGRLLASKHAALLEHNTTLEGDKECLVRDIDDLLALANHVTAERTGMKRVSELHRKAHEEALRHTVARNRVGRETELKVRTLEGKVRNMAAELTATREGLRAEYEGQAAELKQQLAAAQADSLLLRKDLKAVRGLAGVVVGQRTELEKFFYVALEDCRRYKTGLMATATIASSNGGTFGSSRSHPQQRSSVRARGVAGSSSRGNNDSTNSSVTGSTFRLTQPSRAALTRGCVPTASGNTPLLSPALGESSFSGGGGGQLPPVAAATRLSPPPPPPPEQGASIDELSWEDKEKVIKALFFFINSTYYKAAPMADPDR